MISNNNEAELKKLQAEYAQLEEAFRLNKVQPDYSLSAFDQVQVNRKFIVAIAEARAKLQAAIQYVM